MTFRILTIILTLILSSCSYSDKDFTLNTTERSFLDAFKKGDTLCYESPMQQDYKIIVLGIDSNQKKQYGTFMTLPAYNMIFIKIRHLPVDTFQAISHSGASKIVDTIPEQLISITRYPQNKETEYMFQFKHFLSQSKNGLGSIHSDTILNGHKLTNYYIIENDQDDKDTSSTKIERLYWTRNEGLVAYTLRNGTYWTKKSNR